MQQRDIHPIVKQIVDRCHVGDSRTSVVRSVLTKLVQGKSTFQCMSRKDRRFFIEQCLARHTYNRGLYSEVMENRHHR